MIKRRELELERREQNPDNLRAENGKGDGRVSSSSPEMSEEMNLWFDVF